MRMIIIFYISFFFKVNLMAGMDVPETWCVNLQALQQRKSVQSMILDAV